MREKKSRRWLSLLLAVVMLLSLLPSAVLASGETGSTFYRIFHLDCGRKYFSVSEIEGIVDKLAENNYTHLQLAFGNDGLRFLLDDMSVGFYTSDEVTNAIESGNSTYSNSKSTESTALTEAEMDEIIAYADNAGIEIIPLLNTPGHLNVLLSAMKTLGVSSSSSSSFSLTDPAQVSFTQELVGKYITYFAGKRCTFFNMGADEYSFSSLNSDGYAAFVDYINTIAAAIKDAGMKPVAFNDGIYYNSDDTAYANVAADIDKDIIVAYWCQASGYASAATLAANGFSLLNNNSNWYYVLGDALYDVWENGQWGYEDSKAALQSTPCTTFDTSDSTGAEAIGSVMCVWCDYPEYTYESDKVYDLIATMAESNPDYFVKSETPAEPDPEEPEDVVLTDETTGIEVNFGTNNVTKMTVEVLEKAPEIPGARKVRAYSITPAGYTDSATLSIPVPTTWTKVRGGVMASESGEAVLDIEGTLSNGVFTFVAPHFSDVVVYDLESSDVVPVTKSDTVNLTVGGSDTREITGANYAGTYFTENPSIATVEVTGTDGSKATVIYTEVTSNPNWNTLIESNTTSATSYYYLADDGEYYQLYATRSDGTRWFRYNYSLGYYANGSSTLTSVASVTNSLGGYSAVSDVTLYTRSSTEAIPASTTVTFTGVAAGTTYVNVGNTRYTINVVAEDLTNVTPLTVEFWMTNQRVTANGNTTMTIAASVDGIYSKNGVDISTIVPETGGTQWASVSYWKSTVLGSSNKQTTDWGDNKTQDGTDFTRVRYWEKSWAVLNENGTWSSVNSSDQVVAYYMQRIKVIDELTTLSVDWADTYAPDTEAGYNANQRIEGTNSDWNVNNWSALDFQVVYSGGAKNPTDDSFAVSGRTQIFHNGNAQGRGNAIGMIGAEIDPTYKITKIEILNVSNWTINDANNSASDYATLDIEYLERSATVVWDASDPQYAGTDPIVTSVTFGDINANNENDISGSCTPDTNRVNELNNATNCVLIRYYIEADPQYENLTVHYVNQDTNVEFHKYGISSVYIDENGVATTRDTFKDQLATSTTNADGSITGEPNPNVFIENTLGVNQPVYYLVKDFPKIDGMPSAYYSGLFIFADSATVSADGLDIYFYYKPDNSKAYNLVIDFGLPVKITAEALGISGTVSIKESKGVFGSIKDMVYTPEKVLSGADTFSATVTAEGVETTALVNIVPASNVLYEDGFMEADTTGSNESWSGGGSKLNGTTNNQAAGTSTSDPNVYGYDSAYASVTGASGTQYKATVDAANTRTNDLTFTFTGTGFDLIGTCGPATGTLLVRVEDSDGKYVMGYLVDTSYSVTKLYQVPLVHAQDWGEDTYTVTVRGAYINYSANSASTTSYNLSRGIAAADPASAISDLSDSMGFTDDEADSVEYVNMEERLGSTTYTTGSGDISKMTLEIDGFRVYRTSDNSAYLERERGATYVNVLHTALDGKTFTAYVEDKEGTWTQGNYEANGGPQNEVYLSSSDAIAFKVGSEKTTVQISARAVGTDSANLVVNGTMKTITSNTEMYYEVTSDESGVITIRNTDGEGMLALGNLKLPAGADAVALSDEDEAIVHTWLRTVPTPEEPGVSVFEPETLSVRVRSSGVIRNKLVTVTITASTDVAKLTVNGEELWPTNSWQVKSGRSKNYIYVFTDTMKRTDTRTYEIVAYDVDSLASEVYTVQG